MNHPLRTSALKAEYSVSFFFRIGGTLRYLFWNVFGMTELGDLNTSEEFVITQYAGEVLLALYAIASLLVAINMLIAMMSNTYQRVAVSSKDFNRKISVSISRRSLSSGPKFLARTVSTTAGMLSANLTSCFCNNSPIIPVVWFTKYFLYCNQIGLSDLEIERENENLSSSVDVVQKTAKQIISLGGKYENGCKMQKNEKHTCKACQTTLHRC